MAEQSTYIKIDRNIVNWRWFKDSKMYHVFSWLIIMANIKNHDFRKVTVHRGEIVTSHEKIADACGLSVSSVRRVLQNLEDTGEIERTVKDHYQIIKILKYDEYQGCSHRTGNRQPNEQPVEQPLEQPVEQATGNNQRIYKNIKNGKNGKNGKEDFSLREPFPCGAVEKPEWMDNDRWERIKYRTVENIPGMEQGFYDSYIEYEEAKRDGVSG